MPDVSFLEAEDLPKVERALKRYRAMAWLVGVLLAVLVLVGLPMKYIAGDDRVVTWTGMPHGWLYMVLLLTAYDLSRRVGWSIKWVLLIMAAGTVPFLSFVAEHFATKDVHARLEAARSATTEAAESDVTEV